MLVIINELDLDAIEYCIMFWELFKMLQNKIGLIESDHDINRNG